MKMLAPRFASISSLASLALLLTCGQAVARQEISPSEHPAPMLERINNETQALYESVRPGLVRVTLPVPKWMTQLNGQENPLNKWGLDQSVKELLGDAAGVNTVITPTSQPTTAPSTQPADRWQMSVVQRPDGSIEFVAPNA